MFALLSLVFAVKTDPGIRPENEDSHLLVSAAPSSLLCAVCDGMGGGSYGKEASALAVKLLSAYRPADLPSHLADYTAHICRVVDARRRAYHAHTMGTTLAGVSIYHNTAHFFNIGDSRCYLLRNGDFVQVSKDHAEEETRFTPTPHSVRKLTQYLGVSPDEFVVEPFCFSPIPLLADDCILLCSDGLTDLVPQEKIQTILSVADTPTRLASALVAEALRRGGSDNVTALVIQVAKRHLFR